MQLVSTEHVSTMTHYTRGMLPLQVSINETRSSTLVKVALHVIVAANRGTVCASNSLMGSKLILCGLQHVPARCK
jgi:hypothetical protein